MTTDTSNERIAVVLSHTLDRNERMIACLFIMPAKKNYDAIHKKT